MYQSYFKKSLDFLISVAILLVLLPFLLVISVFIKLETKGPIFFVQNRVGKNLKVFKILKFRTMTNDKRDVTDKPIIGKELGVTYIGYFLRRLKIDELPQLINVLKGDMSLVGPRPSIEAQLKNMTELEKSRYSVTPGLTGLAQVSGNIHLSWKKRYIHDLDYIANITFNNDLKILIRTFFLILVGEEKFMDKPLKLKRKNENI